jgi:hypothetical protein
MVYLREYDGNNRFDAITSETFAKPNNSAMPLSSRRYLSVYEHVVKYLVFAEKNADPYGLSGINTKYFITKEFSGISFEISSFRNIHSLI